MIKKEMTPVNGSLFLGIQKITGIVTVCVLLLSTVNFSALGDSDLQKAVIKSMKNKVEIKYGTSLWREASMNQLVRPGTSIRTGSSSKAEVLYPDGTITKVGSRTSLRVLDKSFRAVKIESGKIWFKVTKKSIGLKIYSSTAVAAITGTEGFAQVGQEPDQNSNNQNIRLASNEPNSSFKVAENVTNLTFTFGLEEGTANIYRVDLNGEPLGNPTQVSMGQILSFTNGNFILQNIGVDAIREQNRDVSDKPGDQDLGPDNTVIEDIPNNPNRSQDINLSPTTGDLEIIIK